MHSNRAIDHKINQALDLLESPVSIEAGEDFASRLEARLGEPVPGRKTAPAWRVAALVLVLAINGAAAWWLLNRSADASAAHKSSQVAGLIDAYQLDPASQNTYR